MEQYSQLNFYKLKDDWYQLDVNKKNEVITTWKDGISSFNNKVCQLHFYLTMPFRKDADFLFWYISNSVEVFKEIELKLRKTLFYRYLLLTNRYFSVTKVSQYLKDHHHKGQTSEDRTKIIVSGKRYIFVYPFIKKREWYALDMEKRMEMMKEHFDIGHKYEDIKIHTTYCYGIDDYEFILIFEGDSIYRFFSLVEELRYSKASQWTLVDTPIFVCERVNMDELTSSILF
jgi:chlorite dismutase